MRYYVTCIVVCTVKADIHSSRHVEGNAILVAEMSDVNMHEIMKRLTADDPCWKYCTVCCIKHHIVDEELGVPRKFDVSAMSKAGLEQCIARSL